MKRTELYDRQLFIELCTWYRKLSDRIRERDENTPVELKNDAYFMQTSVLFDERVNLFKRILKIIPKDEKKSLWFFSMWNDIVLSKTPLL